VYPRYLAATDVPRLNAQLTEVSRSMVVDVRGNSVTLDPVLTDASDGRACGPPSTSAIPTSRPHRPRQCARSGTLVAGHSRS
jgi:hypothetical protein